MPLPLTSLTSSTAAIVVAIIVAVTIVVAVIIVVVVIVTCRHRHRRRIPSCRRPSRRRHQPSPAAVLSITFAAPVDCWLLHSPPAQQHTS